MSIFILGSQVDSLITTLAEDLKEKNPQERMRQFGDHQA